MTGTAPDVPLPPDDLTARVFRALYPGFDLHDMAGTYLAVPAGTPCFTARTLSEIACQISGQAHPAQASVPPIVPPSLDLPRRP